MIKSRQKFSYSEMSGFCQDFFNDPNTNPLTGDPMEKDSSSYKALMYVCDESRHAADRSLSTKNPSENVSPSKAPRVSKPITRAFSPSKVPRSVNRTPTFVKEAEAVFGPPDRRMVFPGGESDEFDFPKQHFKVIIDNETYHLPNTKGVSLLIEGIKEFDESK